VLGLYLLLLATIKTRRLQWTPDYQTIPDLTSITPNIYTIKPVAPAGLEKPEKGLFPDVSMCTGTFKNIYTQ